MKFNYVKVVVFVALLAWSSVSVSSNYNFLKNSVISSFTDEDISILLEHVQIGLNENRTVDWNNDTTGNGGTITPEVKSSYKDFTCRYVKITNKSKNKQATTRFKFCKMEDGTWKIVSGD